MPFDFPALPTEGQEYSPSGGPDYVWRTASGAWEIKTSGSNTAYVSKSGDTMTGLLTLSGPPTVNLHAATKLYVDGINSALTTAIAGKVAKAGDTMTGKLSFGGPSPGAQGFIHIRPSAGHAGYLTFTEDAVVDKWAMGCDAGSTAFNWKEATALGTTRMSLFPTALQAINVNTGTLRLAGGMSMTYQFYFNGCGTISDAQGVGAVNIGGQAACLAINHGGPGSNNGIVVMPRAAGTANQMMFLNNSGSPVGTVQSTSVATAYNTSSDERAKKDITPYKRALEVIRSFRIFEHGWKVSDERSVNVLAQEAHEVFPQCVTPGNDDQPWMINYSALVPVLLAAMQELCVKVDELQHRLDAAPQNV